MNKIEIFVPNKAEINGQIVEFEEGLINGIIEEFAQRVLPKVGGMSIRTEQGFYRLDGHINQMNNKVLYFYCEEIPDAEIEELVNILLSDLRQESVLIVKNDEASFYRK